MKLDLISLSAAALLGSAGVPAQAQQTATVQARTAAGGVAVTWRIARPVKEVTFREPDIIRDRWTMATPGLTMEKGVVRSNHPFDTFEILIAPDAAEVDRVYMGLTQVGTGAILYGPGVTLKDIDTTLTLRPGTNETTVPSERAIEGYAYLGPYAAVTRKAGGTVVVGASVPAFLSKLMGDGFLKAQAFYGERLGRGLPYEPALIVTTDSPGPTVFRGDVTNTGVIATRFFGKSWAKPAPDVMDQLSTFVWHETFHLWNGHGIPLKDGETAPWLHEGGAEYGALVAAATSGAIDEDQGRFSLARRLNGCRSALGNRDYDPKKLRSGSAVYDCGVVIQWIADLEARRASDGRHDILDLWKAMLARGRNGAGYGVADFRAALTQDSAIKLLLDKPGADRWASLEARLSALGVSLANAPGWGDYRRAALLHLTAQNCTGGTGFYTVPEGVKLDTGGRCGVLSGDPVVALIEDHDPMVDAEAMFRAIQTRCARATSIRYRFKDGRTVEALCTLPLPDPEAWAITTAPQIATRSS
jgi:hypothetical protein